MGTKAAMIIHAAGESFKESNQCRGSPIYAVALVAPDEAELINLETKLLRDNIQHVAFREPDRDNELMAIGITPINRTRLKQYVHHYKLLK